MSTAPTGGAVPPTPLAAKGAPAGRRLLFVGISAAVVAVFCAFPFAAGTYQASLLSRYLVFGLFAMSFDLLWGYAGIMNFGHAAFFGLGAYSVGMVMKYLHVPGASVIAIIAALVVPAVVALIVGYFLFYGRVAGVYFAIVTMALSLAMQAISIAVDVTGGLNGLREFPPLQFRIPGVFTLTMTGDWAPYYATVIISGLLLLAAFKIVRSSFGRSLEALRDNPERAESLGYNIASVQLIVFVISCMMAGVAGALYVPIGHISPELLGLIFSTNALVWVSIGGRGTLVGGFVGALIVSYLQYFLGAKLQNLWFLLIGVFFILVVLFKSGGIMGFLRNRRTR
jgi:urea transport system permease protein